MIMVSTPWTKDHPFYDAITKPEQGFHTYTWPTRMNPKVTPERLQLERQTIGEFDFNREYNGTFLDDQYAYFPTSLVLNCTDDYELDTEVNRQEYTGQRYVGVDFGKHSDHSTIAILHDHNNQSRLIYLKEFQLETTYKEVIDWLRTLNNTYHISGGCLDKTGVGEAPYEEISNFMPQINGITLTQQTKEDIMGKLRLAMEQHRIIIPRGNQRLLSQVISQQSKPLGTTGKRKFSHPSGAKDDLLWALALAQYSPRTHYRPIASAVSRR